MIMPGAPRIEFGAAPAASSPLVVLARLAIFVILSAEPGRAASAEWTGAADANWATPGNWTATPVPGSGDTATFDLTNNGHTTISLGAGVTIRNLVFSRADAPYTIGAGATGSETLTLNHGGSVMLANCWPDTQHDARINSAVVLGTDAGTASYNLACQFGGYQLILSGNISGGTGGTAGTKTLNLGNSDGSTIVDGIIGGGGGTIAVTLNGFVDLFGTNTFTGPLVVNSGGIYVAKVNDSGTAGPLGAGTLAVQLGGDLIYLGTTASSTKKFTLSGYAAFSLGGDPSNELTLSGVIDGSGSLTKWGRGTLVLTGANTYSGGTGVNWGLLRVSGAGTLGNGGGYLALAPGAKVEMYGTNQTVSNLTGDGGNIVNNSTGTSVLTVTNGTGTFAGVMADTDNSSNGLLALTHSGTGTLTLTGANTYSGATSITAGVVVLSGDGTLGNTTGTTTVGGGATLALSSVSAGAEAVRISGAGAAGCNGVLTGSDATFAGLLQLGADSTVAADSGSFELTNTGIITGATCKLTLTGAGHGSLAGVIGTTTGTVTKTGGGTWTLSGANTFTGALTVSAGTLAVPVVNNASSVGPLGNSATAVTLSGGTLEYTGASATSTKAFTLATNGGFQIDNATTRLTLGGVVAGTGATLTKTGGGDGSHLSPGGTASGLPLCGMWCEPSDTATSPLGCSGTPRRDHLDARVGDAKAHHVLADDDRAVVGRARLPEDLGRVGGRVARRDDVAVGREPGLGDREQAAGLRGVGVVVEDRAVRGRGGEHRVDVARHCRHLVDQQVRAGGRFLDRLRILGIARQHD